MSGPAVANLGFLHFVTRRVTAQRSASNSCPVVFLMMDTGFGEGSGAADLRNHDHGRLAGRAFAWIGEGSARRLASSLWPNDRCASSWAITNSSALVVNCAG